MLRFGVANLRRLRDVKSVDLKRINLLVGRNSSGKSTFLRMFPLLRQSLMTRTSSPILWYGDYVDLGNFSGVVSNNDIENSIIFRFGVDNIALSPRNIYRESGYYYGYSYGRYIDSADIELYLSEFEQKTRISRIVSHFYNGDVNFDLEVDENFQVSSIKFNDEDVGNFYAGYKVIVQQGAIFPEIAIRNSAIDDAFGTQFVGIEAPLSPVLARILSVHLDKRLSDEKLKEIAAQFLLMPKFDDESFIVCENVTKTGSFRKFLRDVRTKDERRLKFLLRKIYFSNQVAILLTAAFRKLREVMMNTLYIGPARARSERYYRYQDLAVSEIDSDGKNFPMFLNSLNAEQKDSFSNWVRERFGYGVNVSQEQGHISISLTVGDQVTNIVDTGYGVSQILPVLGQIWWALNRERTVGPRQREQSSILLIEQPELHLHPAHQALIADAFVGERRLETKSQDVSQLAFIIETHSEALINRIGELIYQGKVDSSDIQILIFDSSKDENNETKVDTATFDSSGGLVNWPYGFFQADI